MRVFCILIVAVVTLACSADPPSVKVDGGDIDGDSDTDSDTDTDTDTDTDSDECDYNIEWVPIPGGAFLMGGPEDTMNGNRLPIHSVTVPSFEMTRSEIIAA